MHGVVAVVETYISGIGGVPVAALRGTSREAPVARWRAVVAYLANCTFGVSQEEIGDHLGGRDRSTIGHLVREIEDRRDELLTDELMAVLDVGVREFRRALELLGRMEPIRQARRKTA